MIATLSCSSQREAPQPTDHGNGTGSGAGTATGGGGSGNGGSGGTPVTTGGNGGTGGTPSTGGGGAGTGGMGTGGAGGAESPNAPSDLYPYCGCISDMHQPGACQDCVAAIATCAEQLAGCAAGCQNMRTALAGCDAFADPSCLDDVFAIAPLEWDDLVALIACQCGGCPAPDQCDNVACQ